jgi:hypothetical protein
MSTSIQNTGGIVEMKFKLKFFVAVIGVMSLMAVSAGVVLAANQPSRIYG